MSTTLCLLSHSQIYLLRAVLASCVTCLLLFIPGPQILQVQVQVASGLASESVPFPWPIWLSLGLFLFILVHHLLMQVVDVLLIQCFISHLQVRRSFNMDFIYGLAYLPPLLLEITGVSPSLQFLIFPSRC